jgi:16S rRNA (guanine(966)-N(2))-methyltransferase RsmD
MRIISGKHKSRRINPPKGLPVRPTTDFAKEGLFNILNNRISFHEIKALELFAGTGNISFELASRGAKEIIAVDNDYGCVNFIKKTSVELEMPIQAFKADVFKYLDFQKEQFNLVFADPPYAFPKEDLDTLIQKIIDNDWLAEDGILILEHSKAIDMSQENYFQESRKYGGSVFSFFHK